MRCAQGPHSAKSDLDAGQLARLVPENFATIELSVAGEIFEGDDPIMQFCLKLHGSLGVSVIFRDP